jgi:hypothetical protein
LTAPWGWSRIKNGVTVDSEPVAYFNKALLHYDWNRAITCAQKVNFGQGHPLTYETNLMDQCSEANFLLC